MFENNPPSAPLPPQPPVYPATPVSPVQPAPLPPAPGQPLPPRAPEPKIYTMPEKFRSSGSQPRSGNTRRLVMILVIVTAVAALGVAGLYIFQNVLNKPASNSNTTVITTNTVRNTNTTSNANANTNGNTNDSNLNVANTNGNTNATNENTNTTTNTNTTANTNTSVTVSPLPSSTDTDSDGVTDVEEVVYGTSSSQTDSDGDGFIDGKQVRPDGTIIGELYNGYNPKGAGTLEASGLVKRQTSSGNTYSVLIPTSWTGSVDQSGGMLITPAQSTGEIFQIRVQDNLTKQSPKEWYRASNPSANVDSLKTVSINGLEGIYSEDQTTVYLFKDTKVYYIEYSTGSLTQANYWTTFDVIARSFKLLAS